MQRKMNVRQFKPVTDNVPITTEALIAFIKKTAYQPEINNPINKQMLTAVSKYFASLIQELSNINPAETIVIPATWSSNTLINRTYDLIVYKGLLGLRERECDLFNHNYMAFYEKFHTMIEPNKHNIFVLYVHSVMLFRQVTNLNTQGEFKDLTPEEHKIKMQTLSHCYQTIIQLVDALTKIENKENMFWVNAMKSLCIHALASIHYIDRNQPYYDIDKATLFLKTAINLNQQAQSNLSTLSPEIVDFYTLKQSLIETLPFGSFQQQLNEISKLKIIDEWLPSPLGI